MSELAVRRLRSGQTKRYHTAPHIGAGQTVSEHSWRAAVLLHSLWPELTTKEVLLYVLYHDSPEQQLGDMPAPAKWNNTTLAEAYAKLEKIEEARLGLDFNLSESEKTICKIADTLELVDHVAHRIMRGDHSYEARNIYWNGRRHLLDNYGSSLLFDAALIFMEELHEQVVRICPHARQHVRGQHERVRA